MASLVNRCRFTTATTGTGSITVGSASSGWYRTPASAGVVDGLAYSYVIEDGLAGELGRAVFSSSGTVMTRTVKESSDGNNAINLSGSAVVFISALEDDIRTLGKGRASVMNQHLR